MISFHECVDLSSIEELKSQHLRGLTAPMDGMWEVGFINSSPHWIIKMDGEVCGYYVVNDEGTLLQFYLLPGHTRFDHQVFQKIVGQSSISTAIVQTIDPLFLSLCLDCHVDVSVHTYLYELQATIVVRHDLAEGTTFEPIEPTELSRVIDFQIACLGGKEELRQWLQGYSKNLIDRKELFVLRRGNDWLGLGEYRRSDTQENVADVGVMVDPEKRGKKWATYILSLLVANADSEGHNLICSTTVENIASQKAILGAGFVSRNRILKVTF